MRHARGFSLLELMVVVAIIGLTMAAGLPSLVAWTGNTRVRNAADGLQNGLRMAQAEAVRRNAPVTLRLVDAGSATAAVATGNSWVLLDAQGAVILSKAGTQASGILQTPSMVGGGSFSGNITFDGVGLNDLPGQATFTFTAPSSDHPLRVLVTQASRVRLCDPARPAGDPQACE